MGAGIVLTDERALGVTARVREGRVEVRQTFAAESARLGVKQAVIGLPLEAFFIKTWPLPELERGEKAETVARLQCAFHLPYPEATAWHVHRLIKGGRGLWVQMLAMERRPLPSPVAVMPAPMGLYSLALALRLLDPARNTLLLHVAGETAYSVTVTGLEVVYLRVFPAEDLTAQARLSAQAVYGRAERELIEPDQVMAFCGDAESAALESVFPDRVRQLRPAEVLFGNVPEGQADSLLLSAGLALATGAWSPLLHALKPALTPWNVLHDNTPIKQRVLRVALWTLPLWPLAAAAWLYADIQSDAAALQRVEGRLQTLNPAWQTVQTLDRESAEISRFLAGPGRDMQSPGDWFALLNTLESRRPEGVKLTNLSGKLDGLILVSANAPDYDAMTHYLAALGGATGLAGLALVYSQQGEAHGVDFRFSLSLRRGAAS